MAAAMATPNTAGVLAISAVGLQGGQIPAVYN